MNEEERASQVSALFDCELESSQSELVLRRIMKDPALRTTWGRYAVIGASLRHEPLSLSALGRDDIATRVAAALAEEPVLNGATALPAAARPAWAGTVYKALWGSTLAAGVAAASILVLRMQALPESGAAVQVANAQAQQPAAAARNPGAIAATPVSARTELTADASSAAPSYTTPAVAKGNSAGLPAPLVNYVVAHSEYLTPVMRFNPLSAVMNGTFEGDELVEATEAEIGAARR